MRGVSQTALAVGVLRAAHRVVDAEPWVIDDTVSLVLFGDAVRTSLREDAGHFRDAQRSAMRGYVLVRGAFAEKRLRAAVQRGVRQCVILGAGFDTFPYRQPEWANGLRIFEVDAPATQAEKRVRLERAGLAKPHNVVYAAIDFERTSLAAGLQAAGFDTAAPAFFSCLGVMVYLTSEAIEGILRYVAALACTSEIAFTFSQPGPDGMLEQTVARFGEPFRTRIAACELEPMLRGFGFRSTMLLTLDEARAFLGARRDALTLPLRQSLAAAIV